MSVRLTDAEHEALIDAAHAEYVVWEREPIVVAVERIVAERVVDELRAASQAFMEQQVRAARIEGRVAPWGEACGLLDLRAEDIERTKR